MRTLRGRWRTRTINIITINTETEGHAGCVIVTTEDNDRALDALTDAGFKAVIDERLGNPPARRARRLGQSRRALQERRRKHPKPAHPRPARGLHDGSAVGGRPRKGGDAAGGRGGGVGERNSSTYSSSPGSVPSYGDPTAKYATTGLAPM